MVWKLITLKHYPIFSRYWIMQAFNGDMKNSLGIGFSKYKALYNGTYADTDEFEKVKFHLVKILKNDPRAIQRMCKKWKKECDILIKYSKRFESLDFSEWGTQHLVTFLEKIIIKFRRSASYIFLHHALGDYLEEWLNCLLSRKIPHRPKRGIYFQILSSPIKATRLTKAEKYLKQIADIFERKDSRYAKKLLKNYVSRYKWLGYDTGIGKDLTIAETKDKVHSIINSKESPKKRNMRCRLMKKLGLNNKEVRYLGLLAEITYMGYYRVESNMIAGSHIRPLLEEIARRLDTSYDNLVQLDLKEIKEAFVSGNLDLKEIEKRKKKYGALMIDGIITIYSGSAVEKIVERTVIPRDIIRLTGLTANPGVVQGYAKIIESRKDFSKVNFGDILVSKTTNPDFIVALQRCSGIVTDIGGITSHAAVIARELNKPCIIGTVYGTKFLKDGDFIEVNADEGVVNKLK